MWFLQCPDTDKFLEDVSRVILSIHINGLSIKYVDEKPGRCLASRFSAFLILLWSSFSKEQWYEQINVEIHNEL